MKKILFLIMFAFVAGSTDAQINKPFTIPEVSGWTAGEGVFAATGRILVKNKDKAALDVANQLCVDAKQLLSMDLRVEGGRERAGDIIIRTDDLRALGSEGYQLRIGKSVEITAATQQGLYWGTRTLLQMMEQTAGHTLPCGTITDKPQYAHRGFMIDCGRKYIPMDYLKKLVRIMGYYKMNVLQVHLNDNGFKQYFGNDWSKTQAAFRLECDTYPGLTARDGSYTKQEFRELCHLANRYGVEIIPEIDVPAHSLAFTHYRPSLASEQYGADHLDLSNPEVYNFLNGLFKEYLEGDNPVFVGPRVCIGTDEYSNADQQVIEQFRSFTDHYIRLVEQYGKTAVVWGALTHAKGTTPVKADGVVMNCWYNGFAKPSDMKELGYKLVSIPDGAVYIVPAAGYYYDYLNIEHLYNSWTPAHIGNETFEEGDSAILGGMFAVWNDHPGNGITVKDIHHRVMPALQTLSAKCWSGQTVGFPFTEWNEQRTKLSEAPGVNELGRLGTEPRQTVFQQEKVKPGDTLSVEEVGWDYAVTFTIDCQKESKGTILFASDNATFFLSDPDEGNIGFAHDGYLETFNYRLPEQGQVTLTIEGTNTMTRLLVDGRERSKLEREELYVADEAHQYRLSRNQAIVPQHGGGQQWFPQVFSKGARMYHVRTLVFPLRRVGQFNSSVTNLTVKNFI